MSFSTLVFPSEMPREKTVTEIPLAMLKVYETGLQRRKEEPIACVLLLLSFSGACSCQDERKFL